jgi:site-specific recombinase XerD
MRPLFFKSTLASYMKDFIGFKRLQAYSYIAQEARLWRFDQFLQQQNYALSVLTADIINAYIEELAKLKPKSRATRLSSVRAFSKFLKTRFPQSFIVPKSP